MKKKVILATKNAHKLKEFREILEPIGFEILSLDDISYNDDIKENGLTFKENSFIKAKTIYDIYKMPVISDDSGLSVDSLNGAPGIYSHRYSGEDATDESNRKKLINELSKIDEPHHKAHFTCAISYIDNERIIQVEGYAFGEIIDKERGDNGFGYDPIFYVKEKGKTFAELDGVEKNKISHRNDALKKFKEELEK